jgi:hypothetical protein
MICANSRICFALAAVLALGLAGCKREANTQTRAAAAPDASAQVIGVKPADATAKEPPGVTPVASDTTTVTKQEESTQKPSEGDNHSYSTVAPNPPQKGDQPTTDGRAQ